MTHGSEDTKKRIHGKVVELAARLGADAGGLRYDELIPERSGLDSAAVMELIVWYETAFDLDIPDEDFTTEHLGTVDAMADYVERHSVKG